ASAARRAAAAATTRRRRGSSSKPFAARIPWVAMARSLVLQELNEDRAIHDNLVADSQAVGYVVAVAGAITQRHVPPGEAAIRLDDINKRQVHIVAQNR